MSKGQEIEACRELRRHRSFTTFTTSGDSDVEYDELLVRRNTGREYQVVTAGQPPQRVVAPREVSEHAIAARCSARTAITLRLPPSRTLPRLADGRG